MATRMKLWRRSFSARSVVHDSTGFAPSELMLGRTLRDLLDILKESWVAPPPSELTSALAYLTDLYQRITDAMDIAMDIEKKAKVTMARSYEAKSREFSIV